MATETLTAKRRSRRGHNEGSIRQRADGRWEATISLGSGKRKSYYGATRTEAQRKMQAAQRDLERGISPADERQTVTSFLRDWLATLPSTKLKPRTIERHATSVNGYLIPHLGRIKLAKVTPVQVQAMYAACLEGGLAPTTVHHIHETLHKALGYAVRVDLVARNVCDLVDAPRMEVAEMQVFTADEARAFLELVRDTEHEALYATALTTGMRVSELLALRWRDVDLDTGAVRVQATLTRLSGAGGGWQLEEPKTKRSRRQIPLPLVVVQILRDHKAAQDVQRQRMGDVWQAHEFVFCTAIGEPLWRTLVYHRFQRVLEHSELPLIRFHDLRHTCATLLLAAGVNPKIVSERLGHASVSITLDIYSHVLPGMQQQATDALETVLSTTGRKIVHQITGTSLQEA